MAIDLEAIRRRVEQLSGNNKRQSSQWKPKQGEYTVRLLPFPKNDSQPFKERLFYYNIGSNPGLLAPKQFGKPDPFEELIQKLRSEGTSESYQMAKRLYPKMRCYAAIVVRGEEDKGVQIWGFGKQVYQDLLNLMLDSDYGDITDPKVGRDVKVTISKPPGAEFAKTSVIPKPKVTKITENDQTASQWLQNVPDIDTIYQLKTYDELAKILNDWLEAGAPAATPYKDGSELNSNKEPSTDTKPQVSRSNQTKPAPKNEYASIDEAFGDLIDKDDE